MTETDSFQLQNQFLSTLKVSLYANVYCLHPSLFIKNNAEVSTIFVTEDVGSGFFVQLISQSRRQKKR